MDLVAEWNVSKIAESRAHDRKKRENDDRPVDEIQQSVYEDRVLWEHEWEMFKECVAGLIREIGKRYKYEVYHVHGSRIGWRNLAGARMFNLCGNPAGIIDMVTPDKGDVTIEVSRTRDGRTPALQFTIYHHDSPTGENYTVTPVYANAARTFLNEGGQAAREVLA